MDVDGSATKTSWRRPPSRIQSYHLFVNYLQHANIIHVYTFLEGGNTKMDKTLSFLRTNHTRYLRWGGGSIHARNTKKRSENAHERETERMPARLLTMYWAYSFVCESGLACVGMCT